MEKAEVDELRLLTKHVVAQVAAYADAQLSGACPNAHYYGFP